MCQGHAGCKGEPGKEFEGGVRRASVNREWSISAALELSLQMVAGVTDSELRTHN